MTVAEVIAELKKLPPQTPVYVYDGDCARWEPVTEIWRGAEPPRQGSTLPAGAAAIS
jgi:hypothetical protein